MRIFYRFIPILIGVLVYISMGYCGWTFSPSDNSAAASVASTYAQVGVTLLGFMLTVMAILVSVSGSVLLNNMREQGHYADLIGSLYWGCVLLLAMTCLSILFLWGITFPYIEITRALLAFSLSALVNLVEVGYKFRLVLVNL